jgi:hypothetical protein
MFVFQHTKILIFWNILDMIYFGGDFLNIYLDDTIMN